MKTSVAIANYNGRTLLERYLPSAMSAVGARCEVVVVDDASTDDSCLLLREKFPSVAVVARRRNGGFSAAANEGIWATAGDLVVLLNNDVEVTPGFLDPILPLFEDEDVFAVSPRILLPGHRNLDEGRKTGLWRHGMFYTDQIQDDSRVVPILYASGCAAVYRRAMLESLGGFDEAYSPFYWEDTDLGYRAWKRGWRSLYQPASTVYHQHSASISKMNHGFTRRIKARNALLFVWRNMEAQQLIRSHRRWLPLVVARRALTGDWPFVRGWADARGRRHEAAAARDGDSVHRRLSDREIFAAVGIKA